MFSSNMYEIKSECYLDEIWVGLYLGHLGSKTRSLGQIIEKRCVGNRGHSFHI
jgi:hypothetical protein